MFIGIAAYCNYKASNGMHIKILFLNNSLTVYSTPFELYSKPPSALLNGTHGVLSLNTIFA